MKKIFFDMDGTLYSFQNGQYTGSKLEAKIQQNIYDFLKHLEKENTLEIFQDIKAQYGEEFSLAFEQRYHIKKQDYFSIVWDVNPESYIVNNRNPKAVFETLMPKGYQIYIVSESPEIWIKRVLTFLEIDSLVEGIYSGQGDERKTNGKLYEKIKKQYPKQYYMIGDQIQSDIVMSKKYGFQPIFISKDALSTTEASYNITQLTDLYSIIK